ncbi:autotransporter outer membrane beta-barrel domain-containing protein, partial [Bradyrhizobium pachyrhizi]|uniref:autotransporter outer membrane beta-barrel domain-containing protein n=2 Tax=Bradyrhizobium TaxID=374 RepID=UPI001874B6EB
GVGDDDRGAPTARSSSPASSIRHAPATTRPRAGVRRDRLRAIAPIAHEPFAGLAWAHLSTDSFAETGGIGAAALVGAGSNQDVGYSSFGARIATSVALTNGMQLTPRASVAWQHAFGDVIPTAALAFQSPGTGFTVAGVPLARNAALIEGGLGLRVTPQASIGIAYVGQLADRVQDHSVKASFSWKFCPGGATGLPSFHANPECRSADFAALHSRACCYANKRVVSGIWYT